MAKRVIYILFMVVALSACGGFSKVQRSTDNDYRFAKAKEYFEKGKWMNSALLLESVLSPYRGTPKGEEALDLICQSYINNRDYSIARTYIKSYIKSYPRGSYIENARYNLMYCYYKESPEVKLDQDPTVACIEAAETYLDYYPNGSKKDEVIRIKTEMTDKLAEKELLNVKMYYSLGDYQGNNYLSAVIVARNARKKYPDSKHDEEFGFYILKSLYQQAVESVEKKQLDRYIDADDEYYTFIKDYPASKFKNEAESIHAKCRKFISKHEEKLKNENKVEQ